MEIIWDSSPVFYLYIMHCIKNQDKFIIDSLMMKLNDKAVYQEALEMCINDTGKR